MADPKQGGGAAATGKKRVSIKDKLMALTLLTFDFVGITPLKDKDGGYIAVLQLSQPIPQVRGTQEFDIPGQGRKPIVAHDVTEIKVHERNFNDDFQFDPDTDTGSYKGSELTLDVSKQGQVWLVSQSFAAAGNEMRTKGRNERLAKLVGGLGAAKPATEGEPKPVATDS